MKYYCNICRKDITKAEFLYSIDKFDRALCRDHQQIERELVAEEITIEPTVESKNELTSEEKHVESKTGWKSALKKVAIATGKGIAKGTRKLVDYSRERIQINRWKEQILREMSKGQLIQLCNKHRISTFTKYTVQKYKHRDDLIPEFITKQRKSTYDEIVSRIKNRLPLDHIINFANSRHVPIRNILADIDRWKANKEMKKLMEQGEKLDEFYYELLEAISSFTPFRKYNREEGYQIDLARHLKSLFPNTKIEESRSSARPDIVTRGIAIEVKGPTFHHDLQTISDKCMRYTELFPKGMIVVLFDLTVTQRLYEDWMKGMKNSYPEVKVIRK